MAVRMQYTYVFVPVRVLGTAAGYSLYFRERRRCDRSGGAMAGSRVSLVLVGVSTVVLVAAVPLTATPEVTRRLIAAWGAMPVMDGGIQSGGSSPVGTRGTRPQGRPAVPRGSPRA